MRRKNAIMYIVKKNVDNDFETLPDIVDTSIWNDVNPEMYKGCSKRVSVIAELYRAIEKRENYYQWNTPTAYGDPNYRECCGLVAGILIGAGMGEELEGDKIVIKKNGRRILVVDKVKRHQGYYDAVRENRELLAALGL